MGLLPWVIVIPEAQASPVHLLCAVVVDPDVAYLGAVHDPSPVQAILGW
jgi:hypothetical protein